MKKVGMTLLRSDWQSPLSPHFGLATWLLIYDTETDQKTFERNRLLMGKGVVDVFAQHHCTDAVFSEIGPGALEILRAAGIRAWYGPPDVPAAQLIDRLKQGELESAKEARSHDHGRTSGHGRGGKLRGCCRRGGGRGGKTPDQNLSANIRS
jgi:predicted Fe-Mo cluster-binding NifX family protein